MRFSDILTVAVGQGSGWAPSALGSSLLAYWDAQRSDLMTGGASVSSWRDSVAGYDAVQAVAGARPTYSATSFNGTPGVAADAVDDELTCTDSALLTQLAGAAAYEIWALTSQDALAADATTRFAVSVGDGSANTSRSINRLVSGGVNRARTLVGSGAASAGSTQTDVDFSGRHVVRGVCSATSVLTYVDGAASGAAAAIVPNTTATRLRFFSNSTALAASFYNGSLAAVLFTAALDATNATRLTSYLTSRV